MERPVCYQCGEEPARPGGRFCREACAAAWAEAFAKTMEDAWCPACNEWLEAHEHQGEEGRRGEEEAGRGAKP